MPKWYERQSSAEIVSDQVIEDSDFNNEYDAIVTAFVGAFASTFGVGHAHTGTAGTGPLIGLSGTAGVTGVTGVLASKFGGVYTSTSDPTVTDDINSTIPHVVGSKWVNTTTGAAYICVDNADGAAVWKSIGQSLWTVKTSAYNIVGADKILASTSSGSFSLVAPSASFDDTEFEIADHDLTFDVNPVHVTGSFVGVTGTFIIDIKGFSGKFVSKSSMFRMV